MRATTTALLGELEQHAWFARVGIKEQDGVIVVSSWKEALRGFRSRHWVNTALAAWHVIEERLGALDEYDDQKKILELRPTLEQLVRPKLLGVVPRQPDDRLFNSVVGKLLGACIELEYADVCPPLFFGNLAHLYIQGHFPCGWLGDFPDGQLIIY